MRIPVIRGVIDRRILVNFRVDPDVLAKVLPPPFRPKLVNGFGMAGICLIRLKHIRPRCLPSFVGVNSENAAHRIAVEWDQDGRRHEGVFIPRRDTSCGMNTLVGGRVFPGVHHHGRFQVCEHDGRYHVSLDSDDDGTHVAVDGRLNTEWPAKSVFPSVEEASRFFECGSLGYSVTRKSGCFDGLELRTFAWHVEPLAMDSVESSFFEDQRLFPAGSVEFDCALLMRRIEHEWHGRPRLRVPRASELVYD
jgi:hypothetical protein